MTLTITFPYGKDTDSFHLPLRRGREGVVVQAHSLPALSDLRDQMAAALDSPISSPPLGGMIGLRDKVVVIINDATRKVGSHLFLPELVLYLNRSGVADSRITFLVATGSHRAPTEKEVEGLIGPELFGRIRVVSHEANDLTSMVDIGVTSWGTPVKIHREALAADYLVLTGGIGFHFLAGFSGGRKSILPGISALDTIGANHRLVLDAGSNAGPGIMDGSPVSEDMMEAVGLVRKPIFLINVVLNEEGEIGAVFAGDWRAAHRAGCRLVTDKFGLDAPVPVDRVIASAGGYPKDINLYQGFKGLFTAIEGVRDGGEVVFLAECRDGTGDEDFFRFALQETSREAKEENLRRGFTNARYVGT